MPPTRQSKTRLRRAAIAILLAGGPGGATLTIPPAALAFPGNPGTPTSPGSRAARFPTNPG
jgi:hypothetical protein